MESKKAILSSELKVGLEIYKSQKNKETIYFSKLVEKLEGSSSRSTISKALDRLFDLGMVNAKWERSGENKWVRAIIISGESEEFFKNLYNEISK